MHVCNTYIHAYLHIRTNIPYAGFLKMSGRSYKGRHLECQRSARLNAMGITLAKKMPRPPAPNKNLVARRYNQNLVRNPKLRTVYNVRRAELEDAATDTPGEAGPKAEPEAEPVDLAWDIWRQQMTRLEKKNLCVQLERGVWSEL